MQPTFTDLIKPTLNRNNAERKAKRFGNTKSAKAKQMAAGSFHCTDLDEPTVQFGNYSENCSLDNKVQAEEIVWYSEANSSDDDGFDLFF